MSNLRERIARLLALADAATPGPWTAERGNVGAAHPLFIVSEHEHDGRRLWCDADALAVVPLRNEAPALLRVLDALLESKPYHCWCGGGRDVQDFGHEPKCERIRAALREAEAALDIPEHDTKSPVQPRSTFTEGIL